MLATGGRDPEAGVRQILERLGMSELPAGGDVGTTDGSNITVSDFGDHAVSVPLQGSAVVFAPGARRFAVPASPPTNGHGFSVTALCPPGPASYAVAVEKGSMLRSDLAIRPARMVAIGDPSFFLNGTLASRANANRDFFLNAVAWLAGMDVSGAVGVADNVLSVRMDRAGRIRFFLYSSVAVPLAAALLLWMPVRRRRRRVR